MLALRRQCGAYMTASHRSRYYLCSGCLELALRPILEACGLYRNQLAAQAVLKVCTHDLCLDEARLLDDVHEADSATVMPLSRTPQGPHLWISSSRRQHCRKTVGHERHSYSALERSCRDSCWFSRGGVMENVSAIRSKKMSDLCRAILLDVTSLGYILVWLVLSAEQVGAQPCRWRWFCMGCLEGGDVAFLKPCAMASMADAKKPWNLASPDASLTSLNA